MKRNVPELRTDWLTGRQVIVAENRAGRPNEFSAHAEHSLAPSAGPSAENGASLAPATRESCPFCPGHEVETPPAVADLRDEAGNWRVRVIPNKFPAVTLLPGSAAQAELSFPPVEAVVAEFPCAELAIPARPALAERHSRSGTAIGAHEVIIETARHEVRTGALSRQELRDLIDVYAGRIRHWRQDGRLRHAHWFKNQGGEAGASIAHLHSQLLVLPEMPPTVAAEFGRAAASYRETGLCPYCRWIEAERASAERIVLDEEGWIAFCPSASLQPLEVWLFPAKHAPSFEDMKKPALDCLAGILHRLVRALETELPVASYNLLLRTGPWLPGTGAWCHWRLEFLPRVSSFAGLELGTGIYINLLSPEHAAERLRTAIGPTS